MKMKRLSALLLALTLLIALPACSSSSDASTTPAATSTDTAAATPPSATDPFADGPSFNWSFGYSAPEGNPSDLGQKYFCEQLKERSNGKIIITCYPNSQIGNDSEMVEGVQTGAIELYNGTSSNFSSFIPQTEVFDLPFAFVGSGISEDVMAGMVDSMFDYFMDSDFALIQMFPDGYRWLTTNDEIRTIDDFKNSSVRIKDSKVHTAIWESLGAAPTPLSFSEVYIALQQGLVNGQENPLATIVNAKFYEQCKYVCDVRHLRVFGTTVMNKDLWESLPAAYQELIQEVALEASSYTMDLISKNQDVYLKQITDYGVELITYDDAFYTKCREMCQPVYDMVRTDVGSEFMDAYLAAIA